jgi:hypothetical protein
LTLAATNSPPAPPIRFALGAATPSAPQPLALADRCGDQLAAGSADPAPPSPVGTVDAGHRRGVHPRHRDRLGVGHASIFAGQIHPQVTYEFVEESCAAVATVELKKLKGVGHPDVGFDSASAMADWLAGRFAGDPAPSTCSTQ